MNVMAIVKRIFRQFIRDKRSIALMLLAPLLILTLTWLVLGQEQYEPHIAVIDMPQPFVASLEKQNTQVEVMTTEEAWEELKHSSIDAVIESEDGAARVTLEGSDPSINRAVQAQLQQAAAEITQDKSMLSYETQSLYGEKDMNLFDHVGPVLIGFFVFFFVFIVGGISFLREKSQGTLDRLFAMPLKKWEIVTGYVVGFGAFTIIQSLVIVMFGVYVLGIPMEGSIFNVVLLTFLLALSALTLGILMSAFAKNEFQMMQFIPLIIVPQAFFSGLFSLESAADWIQSIEKIMPIAYGADALQDIMIRGKGWEAIQIEIFIVIGFSILFFILNLVTLRAYRK